MSDDLLAELDAEVVKDREAEINNLLDELDSSGASAWVPEVVGETVMGTAVSLTFQTSDFDSDVEIPTLVLKDITLIDAEGKRSKSEERVRVIGFHTVLRNEINDANIEPGDTVAVKLTGESVGKKGKAAGKPYKSYKVASRKPQ